MGAFTGFKEILPKFVTDWVFGGETAIDPTPRNAEIDWRPVSPDPKTQLMKVNSVSYGDTNCCTNFSATNDLAAQMDWLIAHGQLDINGVNFLKSNGYIGADGKVNLSPRFNAVMSGTTPQNGNSLPNVWNSLRHDGIVPDSAWPMPTAEFATILDNGEPQPPPGTFQETSSTQKLWNAYFAPVPDSVKALGKQFAQWFDIQYEWVAYVGGGAKTPADFSQLLSVAPIQIATAVCTGWNTDDPIKACGAGSQHATTLLYVDPATNRYDIFDHYNPFMKQFAPDYSITYGMRGVISSKPQAPKPVATPFTYNYQVNLSLGTGLPADVRALQQGLQTALDKTGKPYMKPGVFGPFGPQTQIALGRFQVDHGIADAPQGHDFGPATRAALTEALKEQADAASIEPLPRPLNEGSSRPN